MWVQYCERLGAKAIFLYRVPAMGATIEQAPQNWNFGCLEPDASVG
jgi:hypothetical protein